MTAFNIITAYNQVSQCSLVIYSNRFQFNYLIIDCCDHANGKMIHANIIAMRHCAPQRKIDIIFDGILPHKVVYFDV